MKNKIKAYRKFTLAAIFVLVFLGTGFAETKTANAVISPDKKGSCRGDDRYYIWDYKYKISKDNISASECYELCKDVKNCDWTEDGSILSTHLKQAGNTPFTSTNRNPSRDLCDGLGDYLGSFLKCILLDVLQFVSALLSIAATIFAWVIEPKNITDVIGNAVIYQSWALVRDVLNVSFIFVLLFSAFCTIFQVTNYNYKKILISLVLMALLVNFSFPIARIIIDFSNVLMYFFLNNLSYGGDAHNVFGKIAETGGLGEILKADLRDDIWYIISAIVFTFILAITFLAIAILLVIRVVALAILIIFSSVAFVGSIVPFLSSEAKKWWSTLFQYAFFGPTIAFMLYIAVQLIGKMGEAGINNMKTVANSQTVNPTFIAAIAFYSLPIVVLWMGIAFAQKSSVAGAGVVMGRATKFMGWAGSTFSGYRTASWAGKQIKKGGKAAGKAGLEWTDRRLARSEKFGWLSPTAWKKAIAEQKAEAERKAYRGSGTVGRIRDKINKYIHKEDTRHEESAVQSTIAEKEKEIGAAGMDIGLLYEKYLEAKSAGKKEDMAAILRLITSTNEGNSFMIKEIRKERMRELMAGGMTEEEAEKQMANEKAFEPFMTTDRYIDDLMGAGFSEHMAVKQVVDMGLTSTQKGMYQLHGAGAINKQTKKYRRRKTSTAGLTQGTAEYDAAERDIQDRLNDVQGKINETRAQAWADTYHWTSIFNQNADGSVGDIHASGMKFLENVSGEKLQQMSRIRGDGVQRTHEGMDKIRTFRTDIRRRIREAEQRATQADNDALNATTQADRDRHEARFKKEYAEFERLSNAIVRIDKFMNSIEQGYKGQKLS